MSEEDFTLEDWLQSHEGLSADFAGRVARIRQWVERAATAFAPNDGRGAAFHKTILAASIAKVIKFQDGALTPEGGYSEIDIYRLSLAFYYGFVGGSAVIEKEAGDAET